MMKSKQPYQSPQLTVVTFHVECGFAVSGASSPQMDIDFMLFEDNEAEKDRASSFNSRHWEW